MTHRIRFRWAASLALIAVAAACSDRPSPVEPTSGPELRPQLGVYGAYQVLLRNTPLGTNQTGSARICQTGGWVSVPGAALYIFPGAVNRCTTIRIQLPAGSAVQVDFSPHGLDFHGLGALLVVDLTGTEAENDPGVWSRLKLLYLGNPEVIDAVVYGNTLYAGVKHFSGYVVATGEEACDPSTSNCP